jgi:caffeoyl-CoA O-methyltransferase
MNIGLDQGRFMSMLVSITGAKTVVEVGTFTGMSALWLARGLGDDGTLICFDISEEYLATANEAWTAAGVAGRIEFRLGPAAAGLAELPSEPHIDLAFIDADKTEYPSYWAELVPRLRPGGVIAVDNVFRGGRVVDPGDDRNAVVIAEFNEMVLADDRVESVMLPLGDGLTLARRPD